LQFDAATRASIELNVTDFLSVLDNTDLEHASDSEIAQIYFADFLEQLCMHLFNVFSEGNESSKFFKLFQISDKKGYIQDLVLSLIESTRTPVATEIGGKRQATRKQTSFSSIDRSKGGAFSLDSALNGKGGSLSAKATIDATYKDGKRKETQADE